MQNTHCLIFDSFSLATLPLAMQVLEVSALTLLCRPLPSQIQCLNTASPHDLPSLAVSASLAC